MTLVELTQYYPVGGEQRKMIVDFEKLEFMYVIHLGDEDQHTTTNFGHFKETPEQIEKLLNEVGFFIKRAYKPEP